MALRVGLGVEYVTLLDAEFRDWAPIAMAMLTGTDSWPGAVTAAFAGDAADGVTDWRASVEPNVLKFVAMGGDPERYWRLARWLVARYRARIEHVADVLARYGYLTGDQVAYLIS